MRQTWYLALLPSLSSTICTTPYTNHCVWAPFQTTHTTTTPSQGLVLNHFLKALNFILLLIFLGCWLCKWFSISAFVLPLGLWVERPYKSRPKRGVGGHSICWISVWEHCLEAGVSSGALYHKGRLPWSTWQEPVEGSSSEVIFFSITLRIIEGTCSLHALVLDGHKSPNSSY